MKLFEVLRVMSSVRPISALLIAALFTAGASAAPVNFAVDAREASALAATPISNVESSANAPLTCIQAGILLADVSAVPFAPFAPAPESASSARNASSAEEVAPGAITLPPAPSSLALVFSGLLALGAYQGTRALPRLHVAAVPDWYHAGATQVGHVTPLHLSDLVGSVDLALCFIEPPVAVNPFELVTFEHFFIPLIDVIPTRAPRSPPAAELFA